MKVCSLNMPPVNSKTCAGCLHVIETPEYLQCCLCHKIYDLLCANVPDKSLYETIMMEHKEKWICQGCKNSQPKNDNKNTPVRGTKQAVVMPGSPTVEEHESSYRNITFRKASNTKNSPSICAPETAPVGISSVDRLIEEISLLRKDLHEVRSEFRDFKNAIIDLTASMNLCNQRIDDLSNRVDSLERAQTAEKSSDISSLIRNMEDIKIDINDREQESLANDIEISGIPEEGIEAVTHVVLTVANKVGITLEERDIVSAERVGPGRPTGEVSPRPRPIVVRFARRSCRDQLLKAVRVRRGLTTADMGLTTAPQSFYVNERLTRYNRQLFYHARKATEEAKWKYAWTRGGRIYVRRTHGETGYRLRTNADVEKLFGH